MGERQRAGIKDKFLGYSLDRSNYFGIKEFKKEYPSINYGIDDINSLVLEILDYDSDLLDTLSANGSPIFLICSKPSARTFLNQGGFTALYDREEEDWKTLFHNLWENTKTPKLSRTMATRKTMLTVQGNWTYYIFMLMTIFSFLYVLYDILERICAV
ncbi:MAG: hypothetical protein AAFO99_03415 [Bacteroidota bacterium]